MAALEGLCRTGRAEVPVYDIAHDGRCGWQTLGSTGDLFLAGDLREVVPPLRGGRARRGGVLRAPAPVVTFWRRLTRDLREHRKPPLVLVRRGVALLRDQRQVVAHAVARGCTQCTLTRRTPPCTPARRSRSRDHRTPRTGPARLPRAARAAGPGVVRRDLSGRGTDDRGPRLRRRIGAAASIPDEFRAEVLAMHRRVTGFVDHGRLQLPWPRALGTRLGGRPRAGRVGPDGRRVRWIRIAPAAGYDAVVAATRARRPVPVYVGNAWMPRHVVLALGEARPAALLRAAPGGSSTSAGRTSVAPGSVSPAGTTRGRRCSPLIGPADQTC